jgi:hypothetical protein
VRHRVDPEPLPGGSPISSTGRHSAPLTGCVHQQARDRAPPAPLGASARPKCCDSASAASASSAHGWTVFAPSPSLAPAARYQFWDAGSQLRIRLKISGLVARLTLS